MENAYLSMTVGPVLAKGIAETVVAQPSNPQEFLALYLLHCLQEDERKEEAARQKAKAEVLREAWSRERMQKEKSAVDTIQRVFRQHKSVLQRHKAREAELLELYEEGEAEAQELLDQLEDDIGGAAAGGGGDDEPGAASGEENLEDLQERLVEAKSNFFSAQRFMLKLSKTDFGALKTALVEKANRIQAAHDEVGILVDIGRQKEAFINDIDFDPEHHQPNFSPAAAALADTMEARRDHSNISVSYVLFAVMRSICYLLFNSTPRQVETPAKVAHLLKPAVVVQLLRAFDPCATYDKNRPLDLEKRVEKQEGGQAEEEEEEVESIPVPQPKTRQVRRVFRLLRSIVLDQEYVCELDASKFFDEDELEEDENEDVKKILRASEGDVTRAASIREQLNAAVKSKGGVVLWALLQFLYRAVEYRTLRDEWVKIRREKGLDVPESIESPEDEEEDEQNEEVLQNDEGELDWPAIRRMEERLGVDLDEQLGKIWEARDERTKRDWTSRAEALKKLAEAEEGEDAEEEQEEE